MYRYVNIYDCIDFCPLVLPVRMNTCIRVSSAMLKQELVYFLKAGRERATVNTGCSATVGLG